MTTHFRKSAAAILFLRAVCLLAAEDKFQLTKNIAPGARVIPPVLRISTTGPAPTGSDEATFIDPMNWKIAWRNSPSSSPVYPEIAHIALDLNTQHLLISFIDNGRLPSGEDGRHEFWTVAFTPPTRPDLWAVLSYTPAAPQAPTESGAPARAFFAPVGPTDQPDFLLSGTFLAGGNTKPIYTLEEKAGIFASDQWAVLGFVPGVTSAMETNQGAQPPNNRTRLDPDSFQAAISWYRVDPLQWHGIYGAITQVNLPSGEFARNGPAADIMGGFLTKFALRRWKLSRNAFFVLYPAFGFEGGWNLNQPKELMGAPINLSRYSAIMRGLLGSDAILGIAAPDRSSDVFSVAGSYRVRLPFEDEPFVYSRHGQTFALLTTKARNWVEVNVTYAPWQFKFIGLNAKYQWGSLPPIFSFVDHQVSVGFQLQGEQTNKPRVTAQ